MNPDPLEVELRKLRPRPASAGLEARIAAALARSTAATSGMLPPRKKLFRPSLAWGWGLAGAMALWLVFLITETPEALPGARQNAVALAPVRVQATTLRGARDEGLVFDPSGQPFRQVRLLTDEAVSWQSPKTGAHLQVFYPSEQTRYVPVSAGN